MVSPLNSESPVFHPILHHVPTNPYTGPRSIIRNPAGRQSVVPVVERFHFRCWWSPDSGRVRRLPCDGSPDPVDACQSSGYGWRARDHRRDPGHLRLGSSRRNLLRLQPSSEVDLKKGAVFLISACSAHHLLSVDFADLKTSTSNEPPALLWLAIQAIIPHLIVRILLSKHTR
ncbi:hypothetical protein LSH36_135g05020 [Paralvinella palmiformis]|uniref:Uncharacterized protein n=1 Tax=Paralvinella palmiformis TaxID=53620 RepID=A0AAD9N9V4_9ANNE|nr:hypothetical protein LSH36_135g05020 [Paralvinella palmiformis]